MLFSDLILMNIFPNVDQVYKCKRCRRTLATSHNLLPHVSGEKPEWRDQKWSLPAEEVRERERKSFAVAIQFPQFSKLRRDIKCVSIHTRIECSLSFTTRA